MKSRIKLNEWIRETVKHGNLHPDVSGYLNFKWNDIDFEDDSTTSPENWKQVSILLLDNADYSDPELQHSIAEKIGDDDANRFMIEMKSVNRVHDIDGILNGTVTKISNSESWDSLFHYILISEICIRLVKSYEQDTTQNKTAYNKDLQYVLLFYLNFDAVTVTMIICVLFNQYKMEIVPSRIDNSSNNNVFKSIFGKMDNAANAGNTTITDTMSDIIKSN